MPVAHGLEVEFYGRLALHRYGRAFRVSGLHIAQPIAQKGGLDEKSIEGMVAVHHRAGLIDHPERSARRGDQLPQMERLRRYAQRFARTRGR